MTNTQRYGCVQVARSVAALLFAAALITAGVHDARAQNIAVGPPSFQSTDFPSLETVVLDRLALGAEYNTGDLATLAHLTVLESIAMLADINIDLANTVLGFRLEAQIRRLWDAAAAFEEGVSAVPMTPGTFTRIEPVYDDWRLAYQQVEASLGTTASLPNRAAARVADLTRLTYAAGSMMGAIEADLLAGAPAGPRRQADVDVLRTQIRQFAAGVVALSNNIKVSKHENSGWTAVAQDLTALSSDVVQFDQLLATEPGNRTVAQSLHQIRRRLWQTEAKVARLGWPPDFERQWRGVRQQLNVISGELGLPRVIDLARRSDDEPRDQTARKPEMNGQLRRVPLPRIYRGAPPEVRGPES